MPEPYEEVFSSDLGADEERGNEDELREILDEGCCSPFRLQFERVVSPTRRQSHAEVTRSLSDDEKTEFFECTFLLANGQANQVCSPPRAGP